MILTKEKQAYLQLHLAVLLFGFTAILGDLINLTALTMVWWRVLITSLSLVFFVKFRRLAKEMPRKTLRLFITIGILVGIHWLCFYGAIKLANASIALVCMATASFFTALIEPLILKTPVKKFELALGLVIVPGMALIVSDLDLKMVSGVVVGLTASLVAAWFSVLNKKNIRETDELTITFLELGSACIFLSLFFPFYYFLPDQQLQLFPPTAMDWVYLLILSLLCTTFAYVLALKSLHYLTAFAANLTINLEPVYGIILAWLILSDNQELSSSFYWGVVIILISVFSYPLLKKRFQAEIK